MKRTKFVGCLHVSVALTALCGAAETVPVRADPVEVARQLRGERHLTLDDAVAAALRYSPQLAVLRAEQQANSARALQAGLWPNPQIGFMLEHFGGSGTRDGLDQSETTMQVAQSIELGNKPSRRQRVVELAGRRIEREIAAAERGVVAEVRKRFLDTLLAQERRELAAEIEKLSARALDTVEKRVLAGAAAAGERSQVRVLLSRTRVELRRAEREIVAARRQLAALWGENAPKFVAVGDLGDVAPPPPLEELLARLETSPELTRWQAEVDRRAAAAELERANRIPDVVVGAGARHYGNNNDFAPVVDFSVPLPLFDRNQGAVLEADQLLVRARAQLELARLRARSELLAAYDRLQTQFERISALGVDVLADAKAASAEIVEAHRRGAVHSIDVLAAQRVLLELQGEYFQALADYQAALVDIERLTGAAGGQARAR